MPTKGKVPTARKKVPTAREMEGQVWAALRELKGSAHYKKIDEKVRENLKPFVRARALNEEVKGFYGKSFSSKCARARTSLTKDGLLESDKRGNWWFKKPRKLDCKVIGELKRPGSSRLKLFTAEAIERLRDRNVRPDIIHEIWELCQEFQMALPEAHASSNAENKEVESKAIRFILDQEPGNNWQPADTPDNPNNRGFDLYRTDKDGGKIWCEVKGLSDSRSVSLTRAEFETAQKKGKNYWLYIVANVESNSPTLIRINDPANKAERFTYGTPWRDVAEK